MDINCSRISALVSKIEALKTGNAFNLTFHSDIDECQIDKEACDANQICMNLPGGFRCDCRLGFTLDPLTNACEDINECQVNNHECSESQRCDNTIGSYRCIRTQSCGTGYTFNMETEHCDGEEKRREKFNFPKSNHFCSRQFSSLRFFSFSVLPLLLPVSQTTMNVFSAPTTVMTRTTSATTRRVSVIH